MRWLCLFTQCRWVHIKLGIWQCRRCKTLSIGQEVEPMTDGSTMGEF